jgi:hypothetical protein
VWDIISSCVISNHFLCFWDFKTHVFSCYLFSMVEFVWFASCFWAWILILLNVNHILICMYRVSFKIFVYSVVCVLIAMKHCKHWHKSTRYIDSFFFNKVMQNCTQKVNRRLFFCRFWKISPNLITPPKRGHHM